MEQSTIGKRVQWNRLRWFGVDMCAEWTIPACRNSSYGRSARLVGVAHPVRQGNNRRKDQVAADVTTHLSRRLYRDSSMASTCMTTERGAWRGLRYNITGVNRRRVSSSERAHLDVTSVVG